jgi:hypothetical protein
MLSVGTLIYLHTFISRATSHKVATVRLEVRFAFPGSSEPVTAA